MFVGRTNEPLELCWMFCDWRSVVKEGTFFHVLHCAADELGFSVPSTIE
jgi:hypothetical protein